MPQSWSSRPGRDTTLLERPQDSSVTLLRAKHIGYLHPRPLAVELTLSQRLQRIRIMQQCQQGNVKMPIFLVSAGDAERKVQSEQLPKIRNLGKATPPD